MIREFKMTEVNNTDAGFAICFLLSVASSAGRKKLSFGEAVVPTDRGFGRRVLSSN